MKETFYFSHDYNARNDPKLQHVLMILGHEGKSVYWDLIEMLYESGGKLEIGKIKLYAFTLRTTPELIEKLIHDFDLFSSDENQFWSDSCIKRLTIRNNKKAYLSECGKRGAKTKQATLKPGLSHPLANHKQGKERKGKENKGKEKNKNMKTTSSSLSSTIPYSENENRTEEAAAAEIKNQNPYEQSSQSEPNRESIPGSDPDHEDKFDPDKINDQSVDESRQKYIKNIQSQYRTIIRDKNQIEMWKEVCPDLDILAEMKILYTAAISRDQSSWVTDFRKFVYYSIQKSQAAIFSQKDNPPGIIAPHTAYNPRGGPQSIPLSPYGRILSQEEIEILDAQMIKI